MRNVELDLGGCGTKISVLLLHSISNFSRERFGRQQNNG